MDRKLELLSLYVEASEQFGKDLDTIADILRSAIEQTSPSLEVAKLAQTQEKIRSVIRRRPTSGEEALRMKEEDILSLIRTMKEISSEVNALTTPRVCSFCKGRREFPCDACYESGACQLCGGKGYLITVVGYSNHSDGIRQRTPCPACKGSTFCSVCHGKGKIKCPNCDGKGHTLGAGHLE